MRVYYIYSVFLEETLDPFHVVDVGWTFGE